MFQSTILLQNHRKPVQILGSRFPGLLNPNDDVYNVLPIMLLLMHIKGDMYYDFFFLSFIPIVTSRLPSFLPSDSVPYRHFSPHTILLLLHAKTIVSPLSFHSSIRLSPSLLNVFHLFYLPNLLSFLFPCPSNG
jgi:hypothetical protein